MGFISFSSKEKEEIFDKIVSQFYNANFGRMAKSDFELMMFHFYIKKKISDNRAQDGSIDYSKVSDFILSKELGITQQKVRNLKIKSQLIYPIEFDWKMALSKLTENARYDAATHKITLNIPDPNLFYEIQNFIEEKGEYIEKQLNSKILQLRVEYYIDLIISIESGKKEKDIIKKLKKDFKETNSDNNLLDEKNVGSVLMKIGKAGFNIIEIINSISSLISPENVLWSALVKLIKKEQQHD